MFISILAIVLSIMLYSTAIYREYTVSPRKMTSVMFELKFKYPLSRRLLKSFIWKISVILLRFQYVKRRVKLVYHPGLAIFGILCDELKFKVSYLVGLVWPDISAYFVFIPDVTRKDMFSISNRCLCFS